MTVVVAAEVSGTTVVVVDAPPLLTVVVAAEVSGTTVVVVEVPPLLVDDLEALVVLEAFADNLVDLELVFFGVESIEDFLDICDNFTDEESRRGILTTSAKVVVGLSDCLTRDARRRI
jgi:hypothetical protein